LSMSSSRLAAGRQDARETAHRAASESYPRY
jgi:hypothetical protein